MGRRIITLCFVLAGWLASASAQETAELVERMAIPDWDIRDYHELRKRRDPRCIPLLVRAAPLMDGRGQLHAAQLLELFPADQVVPAFARLLTVDSPTLRFLAARYLHLQRRPGMAAVMVGALEDPTLPLDQKGPLLDRIRKGAPPGVRPSIAAWLSPEVDTRLADRVLRYLLETRDAGATADVERLLGHEHRATRLRAAAFLLRFGSKTASDALDTMLKADEEAGPADWRAMRPYLQKLTRLPTRLQTILLDQLDEADTRGKLTPLFEILRDHPTNAASNRLFTLLAHEKKEIRHDAFAVLDWHARWKTTELVTLLGADDPLLRVKAADALRRADDLTGLEVLLTAAREEGPQREEACRVLAACRVHEAVPPLIEAMGAAEKPVRQTAASGLQSLLWSLYPYRRFDMATTGYDANKGAEPNAAALATLRGWWERHRGADW